MGKVTAKWELLSDYASDSKAVERLRSDAKSEIEEYGPEGIESVKIYVISFVCEECYKISGSVITSPNITLLITLMGCIIASIWFSNN